MLILAHEHAGESFLQEYVELLHDPAHILFELTFTIIFDFVIVYLGYQLVFKKFMLPKLKERLKREIHEEHTSHDSETP